MPHVTLTAIVATNMLVPCHSIHYTATNLQIVLSLDH